MLFIYAVYYMYFTNFHYILPREKCKEEIIEVDAKLNSSYHLEVTGE